MELFHYKIIYLSKGAGLLPKVHPPLASLVWLPPAPKPSQKNFDYYTETSLFTIFESLI